MIFAIIIKAVMIQFRFDSFQCPTGDMKRYYVHQIQQKKLPPVSFLSFYPFNKWKKHKIQLNINCQLEGCIGIPTQISREGAV